MEKSTGIVEGVIVPLLTPLDKEERVDEAAFRALIQHCLDGGVDCLFAGGTSGLGPLLTANQWQRMMEIAHDEVGGSVPLLGGVIATSTALAIERIRILERIGFEHMVVTPTFYVAPEKKEEFLNHFGDCRQATDMEMIVYNIPSCTAVSIPIEAIVDMVEKGWTSVVKESSGSREYFSNLMGAVSGSDTRILQGFEPDIAWGLSQGAKGMVPVCGNYAPRLFSAAWRAGQAGDTALLDNLQERIMAVRETLLMGDKNWLAGAMYGIHTLGIGRGIVSRPILELAEQEKDEIKALVNSPSLVGYMT